MRDRQCARARRAHSNWFCEILPRRGWAPFATTLTQSQPLKPLRAKTSKHKYEGERARDPIQRRHYWDRERESVIVRPSAARITLGFTCKARLNDRPRSGRTYAPCLVQAVVIRLLAIPNGRGKSDSHQEDSKSGKATQATRPPMIAPVIAHTTTLMKDTRRPIKNHAATNTSAPNRAPRFAYRPLPNRRCGIDSAPEHNAHTRIGSAKSCLVVDGLRLPQRSHNPIR